MIRPLALSLILIGSAMVIYHAYQWWDQIHVAVHDPKLAMTIANDWDDRHPEPTLQKGQTPLKKPERGQVIGELIIPRIGAILPLVYGTEKSQLAKGVGQYIGYGTVLPGENGHSVLAGHRETTFKEAGKLKIGDRLYIKRAGWVYTYQVRKTFIVDADDRTVIVPHNKPDISLITCYPFDMVGSAPQRYIIRGDLIDRAPVKK
ncbi:sortase [Marininema halotolerans]|uniref:LPXTG-site transpeptidase (Sortase) family protein n=1 Tax=Marininema halotolerans TaxID=1155944 RepID=A0A1I6PSY7_9BACL|nr:sortase [Marininema halotolerans]SFS43200.1 LPXTG-site transpeptidase (sortase) family protein [Marininema halotolerans]